MTRRRQPAPRRDEVGGPILAARNAVAAAFVLNGFAFAPWVSRIPEIRMLLDLDPGQLGTLLLALSGGAVVALPASGVVVHGWGGARVVAGGAVLVAAGLVLAAAGVLLVVLRGSPAVAALGIVLWGLGASLWFPVGMSAAADDAAHAAARVSVVSTIGYTAFLAGPPLLGYLGDRLGTLRALLAVAVLVVPSMAVVPAARPPSARPVTSRP